jgi:endoglycosylceramidase
MGSTGGNQVGRRLRRLGSAGGAAVVVVTALLLAAACSSAPESGAPTVTSGVDTTPSIPDGPSDADTGSGSIGPTPIADAVELRPLSASADLRIVDDQDREVLLRGVNVTSLGEYWQGDADHPPTMPTTDQDWEEMASYGISVVRLVVNWSRLEPERGAIDEAYLDEIDAYVTAAAERGIYTVIDMHQDAYSSFIATTDAAECAPGTEPGKGWDGAPEWATITDGLSTCITAERNDSSAVVAAWNHFYDDTDGIRQRFAATWGAVAERFAGRPEVAGYNLLNEPEVSRPAAELTPLFDAMVAETVTAIRLGESAADFEHLIFVEPGIPAGNADNGLVIPDPARIGVTPTNIVAAPHNYGESIDNVLAMSLEETNDLFLSVATGLGVPVWVGEYGFWDTSPETLAKVKRFAEDQDRKVLGGAWWQWRQPCGDPHSIEWGGWDVMEPDVVTHLHQVGCPGSEDLGPTEELLEIVGRGYPRVAPGRIQTLTSDPATGALTVEATGATTGAELVVWRPTSPTGSGDVELVGLTDLRELPVPGGWILTAKVEAPAYRLTVSGGG